jgi:very-short-patch-repair endonuclease
MDDFKSIKELARELRNNPTPAEKKLWEVIRKRQLNNCKFLRQHPIIYGQKQTKINFFIPDFYCAKKKLVIEVDGSIHDYQKYYDEQRDLILNKKNLNVLRFKNEELNDIRKVKNKILEHLI